MYPGIVSSFKFYLSHTRLYRDCITSSEMRVGSAPWTVQIILCLIFSADFRTHVFICHASPSNKAHVSDARVGFFSNPRVPLLWNYLARPAPLYLFLQPAPPPRPLNRHTRHCNVNENSLYFSLKVLGNIAL